MSIIDELKKWTHPYEDEDDDFEDFEEPARRDDFEERRNKYDDRRNKVVNIHATTQLKVVLVKPLTYMNLSGEAIRAVVDYYKADAESELIVIYDDISLDVGQLRIRKKGSAGGHNGIKNIIANLKSDTFLRIKIGVGEKPKGYDLVDYVLGHFSKEELEVMKESLENVDGAVNLMLEDKVDAAMNQYNKKSKGE